MPIFFFNEGISFNIKNKRKVGRWISECIIKEGYKKGDINIIFTSRRYIKQINNKYLEKSYSTDTISFAYRDDKIINGDIFICITQVKENSKNFGVCFEEELLRVIIHSILHLIGYKDYKYEEREIMQKREDFYLSLFKIQ